jgi:acyl transferase domain-containing protein
MNPSVESNQPRVQPPGTQVSPIMSCSVSKLPSRRYLTITPSITLDTACSSSLYALHFAVSALKSGDCSTAVVAAANLITAPEMHYMTLKAGVLSPTSACHTFDASADGYGRADGVNAIYLKPLSSAMRDGDKIWAVIRATAINSYVHLPSILEIIQIFRFRSAERRT